MDFTFPDNATRFSRAASLTYPGFTTHNFSERPYKLGPTNYGDEVLEVVGFPVLPDREISSKEILHLQICNGMEDSGVKDCAELIFAAIDGKWANDAVLLTSGFRALSLGNEATWSSTRDALSNAVGTLSTPRSMLVLAFQFSLHNNFQEDAVMMAKQYVQHVIASVNNICNCSPRYAPETVPVPAPTPAPAPYVQNVYGESTSNLVGEMSFGSNSGVTGNYDNMTRGLWSILSRLMALTLLTRYARVAEKD